MDDFGRDPAFAASPSSRCASRPDGLQSGVGRAPQTVRQMFEASAQDGLIEDVTSIASAVRYIEVAPARLFDASLLSELADASDRLAARVGQLQESKGDRR